MFGIARLPYEPDSDDKFPLHWNERGWNDLKAKRACKEELHKHIADKQARLLTCWAAKAASALIEAITRIEQASLKTHCNLSSRTDDDSFDCPVIGT